MIPRCSGLVVLLACCALAQTPAAVPSAGDLIGKMVWRMRQERKIHALRDYGYTTRVVTDRFNDDGGLKSRHEYRLETVLIENEPYDRLVSKDGRPLEGKDRSLEAKREQQFRESVRASKLGKQDEELISERLMSRFRAEVLRLEEVGGHPAWLVTLFPKPDQPPARSRDEKVLGRMQGKIWIDAVRFTLVRAELDLTEPVSAGLAASVREVHLEFDSTMIAPSVWLMRRSKLKVIAKGLFDSARVEWNTEYSDCHPLAR